LTKNLTKFLPVLPLGRGTTTGQRLIRGGLAAHPLRVIETIVLMSFSLLAIPVVNMELPGDYRSFSQGRIHPMSQTKH
jgi:hypothetical protein